MHDGITDAVSADAARHVFLDIFLSPLTAALSLCQLESTLSLDVREDAGIPL